MLEKDTYSDLNEFEPARSAGSVANVFRQDFFGKGYTGELSFLGQLRRQRAGTTTRTVSSPGPRRSAQCTIITCKPTTSAGPATDTSAGSISTTPFTRCSAKTASTASPDERVEINAQMAALELSIDKDWLRHKLSVFYASGDRQSEELDTPPGSTPYSTGRFSSAARSAFMSHQGFNLAGTSVNFKQRDSLVLDFRTSKAEGQSNFVNPGAFIVGYGLDADITPKLKAFHERELHLDGRHRARPSRSFSPIMRATISDWIAASAFNGDRS